MQKRLVLVGDSIFDNQVYVPGEPDVRTTLAAFVDSDAWGVDLWAVDGHRTVDVLDQLRDEPVNPESRFFLSVGGNDALDYQPLLLEEEKRTVGEVLSLLHEVRETFRERYAAAVDAVLSIAPVLTVCTIYNPDFERDPVSRPFQRPAEAALGLFNDVIMQEALRRDLSVIDLRLVCDRSEDFANPIEPSFKGGEKIAKAILATLPAA